MVCPNCGTSNDDTNGERFCRECGTSLIDARQVPTIQDNHVPAVNTPQDFGMATVKFENSDALIGRTIEGRYRIDSKLGAGGMGAVYRGTRLLIGDEMAIKILHPDQVGVSQSAERFRREAQAAARLKHPNAVSVYDFGVTEEGLFYLVMELVEGESVRDIIRQRGPFTPSAAAEVITQVCGALDEAHLQHIVHRDLKPDNIMIQPTAGGLRVKVLDFGIAKLRDQSASNLTQTGSVMGTPRYMSPEQCIGEELDSRSDIYSLGVVLYEMLAGVVPFNSPISTAVVVQHVNQPPPPLRAVNVSIPQSVEAVVMHALEKRRESRPQTAGALASELNAAINMLSSSHAVLPTVSYNTPTTPDHSVTPHSGAMPTMVMPATPPSGNRAAMPYGANLYESVAPPVSKMSKTLPVLLTALALVAIGALAYFFLLRPNTQQEAGALPDHFGIFVRNKDTLGELRRGDFRDVMQARDAMMGDSSLLNVDAKPTLILYSEGQDIPVADLKLMQLDTVDASGKVSYWNYQVSPVEGHPGMKQIRVAGGLPSGKYAFALLNGYMNEGNHKFWPFQVKEDAPAPSDTPQLATIPLKPAPSPTPNAIAQAPVAPTRTPLPPPTGATGVAYCIANNVVLRSSPNLNGTKIGSLSRGQRLYVMQLSSNYDTWRGITANWAYVQPENSSVQGWVFTYFVRQ